MKVDHGGVPVCFSAYLTSHPNWMRLHEVHRIGEAKSMAGISRADELICAEVI
jgi:hypothetical protein